MLLGTVDVSWLSHDLSGNLMLKLQIGTEMGVDLLQNQDILWRWRYPLVPREWIYIIIHGEINGNKKSSVD